MFCSLTPVDSSLIDRRSKHYSFSLRRKITRRRVRNFRLQDALYKDFTDFEITDLCVLGKSDGTFRVLLYSSSRGFSALNFLFRLFPSSLVLYTENMWVFFFMLLNPVMNSLVVSVTYSCLQCISYFLFFFYCLFTQAGLLSACSGPFTMLCVKICLQIQIQEIPYEVKNDLDQSFLLNSDFGSNKRTECVQRLLRQNTSLFCSEVLVIQQNSSFNSDSVLIQSCQSFVTFVCVSKTLSLHWSQYNRVLFHTSCLHE